MSTKSPKCLVNLKIRRKKKKNTLRRKMNSFDLLNNLNTIIININLKTENGELHNIAANYLKGCKQSLSIF